METYFNILDHWTQDYIYRIANRSLFNDVMNELKSKWGEFGNYINALCIDNWENSQFGHPIYYNTFSNFYIPLHCIKIGLEIQCMNEHLDRMIYLTDIIGKFNNYNYDVKAHKFWRNNEVHRELGGGTSICGMYSMFLQNGVKPKLINKIFQANNINFGMKEIIING